MPDHPAKSAKAQIPVAQVASLSVEIRYPIGLADLEYALIRDDGSPNPERTKVRLLLNSEDARKIGAQFLKLGQAMELMGGAKQ